MGKDCAGTVMSLCVDFVCSISLMFSVVVERAKVGGKCEHILSLEL
jgi:hypothetical protein